MPAKEPHVVLAGSGAPAPLGSQYGFCQGHAAYARETSAGCWQVKVHEPRHRDAGLDGWWIAATAKPTLMAAAAASGFSAV